METSEASRLIEYIVEKAREEARELVRRAQEEASRILEEAEREKRRVLEEERLRAEARAAQRREEILSEARREASMIRSSAMSDVVGELEEKAWRLLDEMDEDRRRESLRKLAEESISMLSSLLGGSKPSRVEILVSSRDLDTASELARELASAYGIELVVKPADIRGGVVAVDEPSGVVVDNSYEARFRKAYRQILLELGRELRLEGVARSG